MTATQRTSSFPDIVESVVAASTTEGCVVTVDHHTSLNLRWAVSMPTTNGDIDSSEVTVAAIVSTEGGWAVGTRSGPVTAWREVLHAAEVDARGGVRATEGSPLLPAVVRDDFGEPPAAGESLVVPPALAEAFTDDSIEVFGYAEADVTTSYVGTSTGARWRSVDGAARLEVSAKSDHRRRSAWHGAAGEALSALNVGAALDDVRQGLHHQQHPVAVPAQPTTVILSPSAVADLMVVFWWAAVARDAAEGRSPFSGPAGSTLLGSTLSDRAITLASDPTVADVRCTDLLATTWNSAAATVFDTGASLGRVEWVSNGTLAALAATRAAARELELPFVASPGNLTLHDADGAGTLSDVIARTDRALLVTSLWYIRDVDPQQMLVTGLTRDGTYLVEDGRIVGTTGNFRFNDSPQAMLGRILDAGAPQRCLPREWGDYFTRTVMPALVIGDFGLSTVSTAI